MTRSRPAGLRRDNLGFLLAKSAQRWNEMLSERFARAGFGHVRPSYGSILVPLFEEDGLRLGELGKRARLAKQTMTTMIRLLERDKLVRLRPDPQDARARRVYLTEEAQRFRPVALRAVQEVERLALHGSSPAEIDAVRGWLKRFSAIGG